MSVPTPPNEEIKNKAEATIQFLGDLPSIKINPNDLLSNGKFFTEEEIVKIRQYRDQHPDAVKWSRKDSHLKFSVLFVPDESDAKKPKHMVVLYRDRSRADVETATEKEATFIGPSRKAQLRFGRDLETDEWLAVKIIIQEPTVTNKDNKLSTFFKKMANKETEISTYLNIQKGRVSRENKKGKEKNYAVLTFFKGPTLDEYLHNEIFIKKVREDPEGALKEYLGFFIKAWEKTESLHAKGIAHQDLHGHNIILDPKTGDVVLLDFGLSKKLRSHFSKEIEAEEKSKQEILQNEREQLVEKNQQLLAEISRVEQFALNLEAKRAKDGQLSLDDQYKYELVPQGIENRRSKIAENEKGIRWIDDHLTKGAYRQELDADLIDRDFNKLEGTFNLTLSGDLSLLKKPKYPLLHDFYNSETAKPLKAFFHKISLITEFPKESQETLKAELVQLYESLSSTKKRPLKP